MGSQDSINENKECLKFIENDDSNLDDQKSYNAPRNKWYHINMVFLSAKFCYFFDEAKKLTYLPSLILFLTSLGLSKSEAGIILGFSTLGTILGGPFWGMLADKWKCHRLVIIIIAITSILSMCSQPLISLHVATAENANQCNVKSSNGNKETRSQYIQNSSSNITRSKHIGNFSMPSYITLNETSTLESIRKPEQYGRLFFVFLTLSFVASFSDKSTITFIETGTVRKIQLTNSANSVYGRQRALTPVGGTFGNIVGNLLIQNFPPTSHFSCFTGMFLTYFVFSVGTLVSLLILYRGLNFTQTNEGKDEEKLVVKEAKQSNEELITTKGLDEPNEKVSEVKEPGSFTQVLYQSITKPETVLIYLSVLFIGLATAPMMSFHFLLLKDLKSSTIFFNVITGSGAFGATFGFYFSNKIIKRLGVWKSNMLCFTINAVVLFLYGILKSPLGIVLVRPFFGFSYCLFITVGVHYLKQHSPVSVITTTVSILMSLYYGVGPGIGLTIGGKIYENYGSKGLFCGMAVLVLVWNLIIVGYVIFFKARKRLTAESTKVTL
ncbi:major facilitator superfamily domain-containing protein 6-like [Clytia hemisphaerica]|uniref:Major facilitator superfamily (MFS) profile domain-containing protein n=1 Tax=Clytia hemisphaerica TaxID=252671 RepID=A0A7M5U5Y9_9CNID